MKVSLLYYSKNRTHGKLIEDIISAALKNEEIVKTDLSAKKPLHEIFFELSRFNPDLIISLDGAGFEMRTEMDDPVFTQMPQRMMFLFFDKPYKYNDIMNEWLNLSHYVFVPEDTDIQQFAKAHPNIPNIQKLPTWNEECFHSWFEEYCREMMLK